jgi:hypothetical protein
MRIGIMGAGLVGTNLARALLKSGHSIMFSSRDPQTQRQAHVLRDHSSVTFGTIEETLHFGEVIAVALKWDAVYDVVKVGDWTDRIVIDMTNRFDGTTSPALELAELTKARVVKAFNTIGTEHFPNPDFGGIAATMFVAGDDSQAKHVVSRLIAEIGFEVVDAGSLDAAVYLEQLALFWGHLAGRAGHGRQIAFKLLHR